MSFSKTQFVGILLVVTIVAAGVGTGVAYVQLEPNPITPGAGSLDGSNDLTLESQALQYQGNNVSSVDVTINNINADVTYKVDIHLAFRNTTEGELVTSVDSMTRTVNAGGTTTINVDVPSNIGVNQFDQLQVNVEQNGTV